MKHTKYLYIILLIGLISYLVYELHISEKIISFSTLVEEEKGGYEPDANDILINRFKFHAMTSAPVPRCNDPKLEDSDWLEIELEDIPQNTHICLRATINISKNQLPKNATLLLEMLPASNVYWDGIRIAQNGTPGPSAQLEVPGTIRTLAPLPQFDFDRDNQDGSNFQSHQIAIETSTFHMVAEFESIAHYLRIVDAVQLQDNTLLMGLYAAFMMGVLCILGVLFQLFYWKYCKIIAYQFFSFLCFGVAVLLLAEQWKYLFDFNYEFHVFHLRLILALTALNSLMLPYFYLTCYRIRAFDGSLVVLSYILVSSALIITGFDDKSWWLFVNALVISCVINGFALRQGNQDAGTVLVLLLIGIIGLFFAPSVFLNMGFSGMLAILMIFTLFSLMKEIRTHRRAAFETDRVRRELSRHQFQPHFLLNNLTNIMELIEVDPGQAIGFINALSKEFRLLIQYSAQGFVRLSDEIAICRNHLQLMSYRYQQPFDLVIFGDTKGVFVPSVILHSQIENCFTHNRVSSSRKFELHIHTYQGHIHLTFKSPFDASVNHQGSGVGYAYIKAKLNETCQKNWQFTCHRKDDYWITNINYTSQ